ncbi:MAG: YbdK family carboxylate-amine ligase [Solirubrobacterales bacterium]|nr:YbdK family carboxylate-amine ligase [Solirubrobacterales bacterium]
MRPLPEWAEWCPTPDVPPWTVGVEEEVMLLDPDTWALAPRIDDVLPALKPELVGHVTAETHGSALELATGIHATAGSAAAELGDLRARLTEDLATLGLVAGVAGTHPTAVWSDTVVSSGARYQDIYGSMRELARREPTFALHVHVAVPEPEMAIRALTRLRAHLPVLLAISANSPFWQGRDTGLASARTPLFQAFPRVGIPRAFRDYSDYAEAIDLLLRCEAFPEPTFLWWDVRLQPRFGTIEVRVMDAQIRTPDTAALVALVQCLVCLEAMDDFAPSALVHSPEVLDENRFLAARDGVGAELIDPVEGCRRPVLDQLDELLGACAPHAAALHCEAELASVTELAADPGAERQRVTALGPEKLEGLVRALAGAFSSRGREPALS